MTAAAPVCAECRTAPVYARNRCNRCYQRHHKRQVRANYPIAVCAACRRTRPIARKREGWCESCVTRWQRDGRPDTGPPPLDPRAVAAARAAGAAVAREAKALYEAIRLGGWGWAITIGDKR